MYFKMKFHLLWATKYLCIYSLVFSTISQDNYLEPQTSRRHGTGWKTPPRGDRQRGGSGIRAHGCPKCGHCGHSDLLVRARGSVWLAGEERCSHQWWDSIDFCFWFVFFSVINWSGLVHASFTILMWKKYNNRMVVRRSKNPKMKISTFKTSVNGDFDL